jgi:hypothetical protein
MDLIHLAQDRDQGNEPSGSIKFWKFLEWLSDWWLLKEDSAPWSFVKVGLVRREMPDKILSRRCQGEKTFHKAGLYSQLSPLERKQWLQAGVSMCFRYGSKDDNFPPAHQQG